MASAGDDDGIAAAVQQREPPASVPLCTEDVHVREPGLWVGLSKDALSSDQALAAVASPAAGATSMFVGTTRDNFAGRAVKRLEYEAYDQMAIKEMRKVTEQMRERWDIIGVAMVHRLGLCPIGEASVIIAVSSAHRRDALDAVSFGIDTLKTNVPIWKKEVYEDGDSTWKENCKHTHQ